jgi:hypothetical protein
MLARRARPDEECAMSKDIKFHPAADLFLARVARWAAA